MAFFGEVCAGAAFLTGPAATAAAVAGGAALAFAGTGAVDLAAAFGFFTTVVVFRGGCVAPDLPSRCSPISSAKESATAEGPCGFVRAAPAAGAAVGLLSPFSAVSAVPGPSPSATLTAAAAVVVADVVVGGGDTGATMATVGAIAPVDVFRRHRFAVGVGVNVEVWFVLESEAGAAAFVFSLVAVASGGGGVQEGLLALQLLSL